jgi:hypothetical protein
VSFTSTPLYRNADVIFTVTATRLSDGSPVTGAKTNPEVFLGSPDPSAACPMNARPAPNSNTMTTEGPPGTYKIGPLRFDTPGEWTVRFHFFEDCFDAPDSPHGHVAFLFQIP